MSYDVKQLLNDVNGTSQYSEDIAAMGTIPESHFLHMYEGIYTRMSPDFNNDKFLNSAEFTEMFLINAHALHKNKVSESDSAFCAFLKTLLCMKGFVAKDLTNRAVYIDEYLRYPKLEKEPDIFVISKDTVQFITMYWANIVGVTRHVFRVRGHHWKPEYTELYERTWRSTAISVPANVRMPTWEVISKAALHCFGIRALEEMWKRGKSIGILSKALELREDAACAGSASIRTTAAAISEMRSAPWFHIFEKARSNQIQALILEADRLRKEGTRAHINARLYNFDDKFCGTNEELVRPLAPFVLGWLDTLEDNEPIKKQKAINKRSAGSTSLRASFSAAVLNDMKNEEATKCVEAFFEPEEYRLKKMRQNAEEAEIETRRNVQLISAMKPIER